MSREMEQAEPLAEPTERSTGKGRRSVVFRVLDLIQLVAASPQPMTLAEIASHYSMDETALRAANGIPGDGLIAAGKRLRVRAR